MVTLKTDTSGYLKEFPRVARDGYVFGGWFTQPNGQGMKVEEGHQFSDDTILYAYWISGNAIVITLDLRGGSASTNTINLVAGDPIGALPIPTRQSYDFDGWWSDPVSGTQITEKTTFQTSTTIYAHWKDGFGMGDTKFDITDDGHLVLTDTDGDLEVTFNLDDDGNLEVAHDQTADVDLDINDSGHLIFSDDGINN